MLEGMATRDVSATRVKILEIASELFTAKGYAGTSISDIAGRLGSTK
ncbi:MAG: TetR family transcriptional regulator, partial [Nocardiopsaceae bacterium]|nr:TetR family transcriptional regulator [Nocardiopsaceae bacterium]